MRRLLLILLLLAAHSGYSASFVIGLNGIVNITPTAYVGVGVGGGVRTGCAWGKTKLLLSASYTRTSFYVEAQFTYKVLQILYTGAVVGINSISTDFNAVGSGTHAGLLLGLSNPISKHARLYFEFSPRLCFVHVNTSRSLHGLSYTTDDGMKTHLAIPLNVGVNFYIRQHKQQGSTVKN